MCPRCIHCLEKFEKKYPNQMGLLRYCLEKDECISEYWKAAKKKDQEKQIKAANRDKQEFKKDRKQDYEKKLERIFNEFIRERDRDKPCISCDAKAGAYRLTAGHYFPAGSNKNVRFDEDNVMGQCWYNCNKNRHGNLSEYLPRLIVRIGQERYESLLERRKIPRKYTIPELKEMIDEYKRKVKELKINR